MNKGFPNASSLILTILIIIAEIALIHLIRDEIHNIFPWLGNIATYIDNL